MILYNNSRVESKVNYSCTNVGWLGRAMVLGSFQCRGVLLLWHMVGHVPVVLAAPAGRVGCFCLFFISSMLSSFSKASSLGRRLDILKIVVSVVITQR